MIGLSLNSAGYMAEIMRAGPDRGGAGPVRGRAIARHDGACSALPHVVLPQVFRTIYAPLGNQVIAVILASSLASVIAVE